MSDNYLNLNGLSWFLENLKNTFPTKNDTISIKDAEIILNTMKLMQEHITVLEMIVGSCECGNKQYFIDSKGDYVTTNSGDIIIFD